MIGFLSYQPCIQICNIKPFISSMCFTYISIHVTFFSPVQVNDIGGRRNISRETTMDSLQPISGDLLSQDQPQFVIPPKSVTECYFYYNAVALVVLLIPVISYPLLQSYLIELIHLLNICIDIQTIALKPYWRL